ncbi:MAG: glutamate--tRNA ligase, partial [Pseudomonadota bacterium]
GQQIAVADDAALLQELQQFLSVTGAPSLTETQIDGMVRGMYCLKERAKTFPELIEKAHFILTSRPIEPDEKSAKNLDDVSRGILSELTPHLQNASWSRDALEQIVASVAEAHDMKLGKLAGPLRAALAGRAVTPSVFDMMLVLGQDETVARLQDASA